MSNFWWLYIYVIVPGVFSDFNGPVNTTVKETADALLTCSSLSGEALSFAAWSDEDGTFASGETLLIDTGKYSNFELDAHVAYGQYNLRINNAKYEDEGMYSCQIGTDPAKSAMLYVEGAVTTGVDANTTSPSKAFGCECDCECDCTWRDELIGAFVGGVVVGGVTGGLLIIYCNK